MNLTYLNELVDKLLIEYVFIDEIYCDDDDSSVDIDWSEVE